MEVSALIVYRSHIRLQSYGAIGTLGIGVPIAGPERRLENSYTLRVFALRLRHLNSRAVM